MIHEPVEVVCGDGDGARLAEVRGMLDVFSSPTLVGRTLGGLPDGTRELVIDLREVTFVDSAGVSAIAHLQHECTTRNVHLHARFGGADRSIHTTVVQVLRRLVPCDD